MTGGTPNNPMMLLAHVCQAAVSGDLSRMQSLMEQKADVNLGTPHDERTALHFAAAGGHLALVKHLVDVGNVQLKRDRYGMLPTQDAKQNGHAEVRAFLQEIELKDKSQADKACPFEAQKDTVFGLIVRDGIFSYHTVQNEVQDYYNTLGLHNSYFEHFTGAQISRHIQCLMAAKKVSETRGERHLRFHIEDKHNGFFLSTLSPSPKHREIVDLCDAYLVETLDNKQAYSLTFMGSDGPAFAKGGKDERLGIYIVDRTHWEPTVSQRDEDVDLRDETDLQCIATTQFLKRLPSAEQQSVHQRLIERAVRTKSMAMEVFDGSAFPGPVKGGYVVFFATYEPGGRSARPLFADLEELLRHSGIQPKRYYIQVFANGASTYALFFPDAVESDIGRFQSAMRYIQHTKRTGRATRVWEKVMGGAMTPEQSVYVLAGVKFCFTFFPREKYVPQYTELQQILHVPESLQKLDELFLQTIREIITPERIYDIICEHIDFVNPLFEDFKQIGLGQKEPFWNATIMSQIEDKVRDPLAVQVLRMFVLLNQCTLITNFFRSDQPPSAICLCLDPVPLLAGRPKSLYPEVPFGIYFVLGRAFYGFHVRFREIARGGVRVVRSPSQQVYDRNAATLFEEGYNLAYTQQQKNKDIAEGGSKGVILLDYKKSPAGGLQPASFCQDSFLKYLDAILDAMLKPPGVISHLQREEHLFFGPDENTADCMDIGALRARERGHRFWKAMTTGKSVQLGGVPHDVYGITTRGVRAYARELYRTLDIDEQTIRKVQTGGPDGDLGSNEILQSTDMTVALIDASGVAYDPAGLSRPELERLARGRQMISSFSRALLGPGGFLVTCKDENIKLPDGSQWRSGTELRDQFIFTPYARADTFVPCGGRPATINGGNVKKLLQNGAPWRFIVEGANLFITDDARRALEDLGVHIFKDSTANKGGVTSSSMEVLASLAMTPEDHDRLLTLRGEDAELPDFYLEFVKAIIDRIEENCRDEFRVIWEANTSSESEGEGPMTKIDASKRVSQEINLLCDHISAAELDDNLLRTVIPHAVPKVLVDHCGVDGLLERVPLAYLKATVACYLSSKYVYEHGVVRSNAFAFHSFISRFSANPSA